MCVGVPNFDSSEHGNVGAVMLFGIDGNGDATFLSRIDAKEQNANDVFGTSLSLARNVLVVGIPNSNQTVGSAQMYRIMNHDQAEFISVVEASDGSIGDNFAKSLFHSDGILAIGSHGADPDEIISAGASYLYDLSQVYLAANQSPVNIGFSTVLAIVENQPVGSIVGEFNASDPEGDAITYHFLSGENNNSLFTLDTNGTLKTATTFDYESNASSYTISVQAKDELNATTEAILNSSGCV